MGERSSIAFIAMKVEKETLRCKEKIKRAILHIS